MSYHAGGSLHDMSSYVAVSGTPQNDTCSVYGLTPQEVRYLKVGVHVVMTVMTNKRQTHRYWLYATEGLLSRGIQYTYEVLAG
jgi:hypothetical protein